MTTADATTSETHPHAAVIRVGALQLWLLAEPDPTSGWPAGRSAATWVLDDGGEIQILGWFVPAST